MVRAYRRRRDEQTIREILVILLIVSNLSVLWSIDYIPNRIILIVMLVMFILSSVSHCLEVMDNFMERPIWQIMNRLDFLWMFILIGTILYYCIVNGINLIELITYNYALSISTVCLFIINKLSTMLRLDPKSYHWYAIFHSFWHAVIFPVIGRWLYIIQLSIIG